MNPLHSSQDFVRSLKLPADPPIPDGLSKIQIARQAWDDKNFYIPGKAEIIAEWILSAFLKEKALPVATNPVLKSTYWTLLLDVLPTPLHGKARPTKTWLNPLLHRIPLYPIVSTVLKNIDAVDSFGNTISTVVGLLWPTSAQKMSLEQLMDLFGLLLEKLDEGVKSEGVVHLGTNIVFSFRNSLANSSNKKKAYQNFLQSLLFHWLSVLTWTANGAQDSKLTQNIYDAGLETLFNLDVLRQTLQSSSQDSQARSLFKYLQDATVENSRHRQTVLLHTLPRLFLSYVQALKRSKGAVFTQGSSSSSGGANEELNKAAMRTFITCEGILAKAGVQESDEVGSTVEEWNSRLALLDVVYEERLFSVRQEDATAVLNGIIQAAVDVLSFHSWKGVERELVSVSIRCLHKIGQIDCDLLLPAIPRILPCILPIPTTDSSPSLFLDLILDYHIKTRALNTHTLDLLSSQSLPFLPPTTEVDHFETYRRSFSGHVLGTNYLDKLGNAIRRFLTPGQTAGTVESVVNILGDSLERFFGLVQRPDEDRDEEAEGRKSKKRKKNKESDNDGTSNIDMLEVGLEKSHNEDVELLAISFALQAHIGIIVLSNLPLHSLTEDSTSTVRGLISDFRERIVSEGLRKLLKTKQLVLGSSDTGKKRKKRASRDSVWGRQIVCAAMLRMHYALNIARGLVLGVESEAKNKEKSADKVVKQAMKVVVAEGGKGNMGAELEVEIFRTLLYYASIEKILNEEQISLVFDQILSYLDGAIKTSSEVGWSGLSCDLKTSDTGALALLHLLVERWLPFLDYLASPGQLLTFVQILVRIDLNRPVHGSDENSHTILRAEHIILRLLHSAEFWEMHNIRDALLSHLIAATDSESGGNVYQFLLYVPVEYLTKNARIHFVKRAYASDFELVNSIQRINGEGVVGGNGGAVLRSVGILRIILNRIIGTSGFERGFDIDLGNFIVHLMAFDYHVDGQEHDAFVQSTLELLELCFSEVVKLSSVASDTLFKVISTFSQYPMFRQKSEIGGETFQSKAVVKILDIIKRMPITSLSPECFSALESFYENTRNSLYLQLHNMQSREIVYSSESLTGWRCALQLCRWLGVSQKPSPIGNYLVSMVMREKAKKTIPDDIIVYVFAALGAELLVFTEQVHRRKYMDLTVSSYIAFYECCNKIARVRLDEIVSSICKTLPPDDYAYILDLLSEFLSEDKLMPERLQNVLHLSILLLREHPSHTLKHMQTFATHCFNTFAARRTFVDGPVSLRLQTLEFLVQHCSEQPAALRSTDLASIYLVLYNFLEPSEKHDDNTTSEIFHKIVATVGALIRLRRDLVIPMLPHLGLVLRQLLFAVRSCRPHLGSKQIDLVMRTQPRWIDAKKALGGEEGRALSRLLEGLNTKTIIRSHTANETQKAESLGKPFSKHAAYVLAAYVEALNDPLCVLTTEMRRELEPGLFVICGIMGEHARDALMVGLDTSGKATLKSIWKEYEKQRYVGQG